MAYRIVRFYQTDRRNTETIRRGVTLEEAQAHCADRNTSSQTAWTTSALARTRRWGPWFDGYFETGR